MVAEIHTVHTEYLRPDRTLEFVAAGDTRLVVFNDQGLYFKVYGCLVDFMDDLTPSVEFDDEGELDRYLLRVAGG